MKLVTYRDKSGGARVGRLEGDDVMDLGFDGDMVDFIAQGAKPGQVTRAGVAADLELCAPLQPVSLRDFLTFEGHMKNAFGRLGKEIPKEWFSVPAYYKGVPTSVIGPEAEIPWPSYTAKLDHELELGIIIGKPGRDIPADRALDHVFGYTIWNDMSARDVQMRELPVGMGPAKAKDWDGANVLGPCIVTADEIDAHAIELEVRVNGERWGGASTADMRFTIEELIEYASMDLTLHPGELLGTGTVTGGSGLELDRWIQPGDIIEMTGSGIGTLRNTVGRRADSNSSTTITPSRHGA